MILTNGPSTEAIPRGANDVLSQLPSCGAYKALMELGKAYRTIFLCRYLRLLTLRREIQEYLNVIENWNSANDFILFGNGGEIATNRQEDQELMMLAACRRAIFSERKISHLQGACSQSAPVNC